MLPYKTTAACILFLIVVLAQIPTLCPTVYWLDTGEFLAAISCLGLAHSPSFPTYVLGSHPLIQLPVGDIAMRCNLSSSLFAGISAVLGFFLFLALVDDESWKGMIFGFFSGLFLAMNPSVWFQSLKAEVYSLNLAFLLLILLLLIRLVRDGNAPYFKYMCFIFFLTGLALGNHLLLAAEIIPAIVLLILLNYKKYLNGNIITYLTFGILGISIYLYLPIRSLQNPPIDLGNPEHWITFVNSVTRRGSFGRFFGNRTVAFVKNIPAYFHLFHESLPIWLWILVIAGIVFLYRSKRIISVLLIVPAITNIFMSLLNKNFNVNPDTGPAYLMFSTACWLISAGIGTYYFWNKIQIYMSASVKFTVAISLICALTLISANYYFREKPKVSMADEISASSIGHAVLENCRQNAVIFTGFYSNIRYVITYLQVGEQFRRDIEVIDRAETVYWPGGLEKLFPKYSDICKRDLPDTAIQALKYLSPRGARHSLPRYSHNQAKTVILNFLAKLAIRFSQTRPVYWIPSEDDLLLGRNIYPFGIMLAVNSKQHTMGSGLNFQEVWNKYRGRIRVRNIDFRNSVGRNILADCLVNVGNSLDIAGYEKSALQAYNFSKEIRENSQYEKLNRKIVLEKLKNETE